MAIDVTRPTACKDIPKAILGNEGVKVIQKTEFASTYAKDGTVPRNSQPQKIFDCKDGVCEDQFGKKKPAEEVLPKEFFAKPEKAGFWDFLNKKEDPVKFLKMDVDKSLAPCLQDLVGDKGTVEQAGSVRNPDGKGSHFKFTLIPAVQNPDDPIVRITNEVYPNNKKPK